MPKSNGLKKGTLNVSYNCLDRHLKEKGDKVAIIWESDDPSISQEITYNQLHKKVCKLANGLKKLGIKKGDKVTIYLPMIPEAAISMLACSRIGAVHSVVFGGFAPESLRNRIEDCESSLVITANEGIRGNKKIPLLSNVKKAISGNTNIKKTVVVKRTESESLFDSKTDIWYHQLTANESEICEISEQDAEDPFYSLYIGLNRKTKRSFAHNRWISTTYFFITQNCV